MKMIKVKEYSLAVLMFCLCLSALAQTNSSEENGQLLVPEETEYNLNEGKVVITDTKVFSHISEPLLTQQQQMYNTAFLGNQKDINDFIYVEINKDVLKHSEKAIFNIPFSKSFAFSNATIEQKHDGRVVWKGVIEEHMDYAHFVINGDLITGTIHLASDHIIYEIVPLGENLHVMRPIDRGEHKDHSQILGPIKDMFPSEGPKSKSDPGSKKSQAGECKIRLLVAYTTAVDNASADIKSYIDARVLDYNACNDASNAGHNVELARVVETNYSESFAACTHPVYGWTSTPLDLCRLREPSDGFMDDLHDERELWDADLVALMCTDNNGWGGYAYDVGSDYDDSFMTMVWNNGAFTFHHEFGHLVGFHHKPGDNWKWAYGNGYVTSGSSSYRGVMPYSNHCGSGPCTLQNRWSNRSQNNCGNGSQACGTAADSDNARVSRERDQTIAGFEAMQINKSLYETATVRIREVGNLEGELTIDNDFAIQYQNGSSGYFRAENTVTLKGGFWARRGTTFEAYLDGCSDVNLNDDDPEVDTRSVVDHEHDHENEFLEQIKVYPNPFDRELVVSYDLHQDYKDVYIRLVDVAGSEILRTNIEDNTGQQIISGELWQAGVYIVQLIADGRIIQTSKVIKAPR